MLSYNQLASSLLYCMRILTVLAPAIALGSDGTTVAAGSTQTITGPDGVCKNVTNANGSYGVFVPTLTVGEWQSFLANPGLASLSNCCTPSTTITGYGACSVSCGGGTQAVYYSDSCGNSWTGSQGCNAQACACTPTGNTTEDCSGCVCQVYDSCGTFIGAYGISGCT